jgi:glycosyltransferase involved in cell wall biosynthesis
MFSRVENLPCVILEALSCGLPVISSDVGGIREWINDTNGVLVKPDDGAALLNALVSMLDNYSKYDRQSLHQFAVDHFSQDVIAKQFHDIYNIALNTKDDG